MDFLTDPFLIDPGHFDGPVLVTGAGGCIGAWACAILARSGVEVVASDLRDDRRRNRWVMGEAADTLIWEETDIADAAALHAIVDRRGITAIIHLAGMQVPFCKANPALGARVNVEGSINVLEAARAAGIKRTAYASSVAALAMAPGSAYLATIYGAYKLANEQTAKVYWQDWQVPSVGIRPNIVYGVGRDQGMTSKCTSALLAATLGEAYEVPYAGATSWLYAGEAAAAFIAAVSADRRGAPDFDLNGACETVETGMEEVRALVPGADLSVTGARLNFPPDLSDEPLRAHVGAYPQMSVKEGLAATHRAFQSMIQQGVISAKHLS